MKEWQYECNKKQKYESAGPAGADLLSSALKQRAGDKSSIIYTNSLFRHRDTALPDCEQGFIKVPRSDLNTLTADEFGWTRKSEEHSNVPQYSGRFD